MVAEVAMRGAATGVPIRGWVRRALDQMTAFHGDITGLRMVEVCHNEVAEARHRLLMARKNSSLARKVAFEARTEVESLRAKSEALDRIDPRFPALIQREHDALRTARDSERAVGEAEELERIEFEDMSAAVERSHAQEREYAERTKWYSISASVFGAMLGLFGSTFVAKTRNQHVRDVVLEQSDRVVAHVDNALLQMRNDLHGLSSSLARATPKTIQQEETGVVSDEEKDLEAERSTNWDVNHDEPLLELITSMQHSLDNQTYQLRIVGIAGSLVLVSLGLVGIILGNAGR